MAHLVIGTVCGKKFDRDTVQAVKSGARRYAHQSCMPDGEIVPLAETVDPELEKLKDYIKKIYKDKANWALINKQIKDYQAKYNYTISGILKSLVWFYDVKGNDVEKSIDKSNGGLGIVPFCYNDAYNYYYDLFVAKSRNEGKNVNSITSKVKEITIRPPQISITKRLFNFLDENDEEVGNE